MWSDVGSFGQCFHSASCCGKLVRCCVLMSLLRSCGVGPAVTVDRSCVYASPSVDQPVVRNSRAHRLAAFDSLSCVGAMCSALSVFSSQTELLGGQMARKQATSVRGNTN